MNGSAAVPRAAAALSAAGVVPFAGGAVLAWTQPPLQAIWMIDGVIAYGAVIVSFLGGIHWGFAAAAGSDREGAAGSYAWSVVPSLLGWSATLLPQALGLALLVVTVPAVLAIDRRAVSRQWAPVWWMRLRLPVTAAVLACLAATLAAYHSRI